MNKSSSGFTIVELLIVIVVIAVLAAISVVAYNGINDRARSSTLQSDLANAAKKLGVYKATATRYPTDPTALAAAQITASKGVYDTTANNFYYCYNFLTDNYSLGARTVSGKASYIYSSKNGLKLMSGGVNGDNVCQEIDLTAWNDPNGFISNGHTNGSGWLAWVR